jgi:mono/diheme cytochrome c family protein
MIALLLLVGLAHAEPDGAALYQTYCSACHGAAGRGDGPVGVALTPKPARFADPAFWAERDDATVKKAIVEGGPAVGRSPLMAGFAGRLDEPQVDAIVVYLRSTFAPADTGDAAATR